MISPHGLGVGAVIGGFALAGCVTEPKTGPGSAIAPALTMPWDGTYRGNMQVSGTGSGVDGRWCETVPGWWSRDVTGKSCSYALPHSSAPDNPIPILLDHRGIFRSQIQSEG